MQFISSEIGWKEISASLGIYTILCWSSDAPPPSVLQKFKFLASSIVQKCHRLPDVMLSVCVFSAGHTHCWSASWGHSQCYTFECWHARWPSRLARLVKDLTCAAASQAYVECIFSACGLLCSGRRRAMFRYLEMSVCIKLRQCWKKRLAHGDCLSQTWC